MDMNPPWSIIVMGRGDQVHFVCERCKPYLEQFCRYELGELLYGKFCDLRLGVRSYNCLVRTRWNEEGIDDRSPAEIVLSISHPNSIKNFGVTSFIDTLNALRSSRVPVHRITGSRFFQTAPNKWQQAALSSMARRDARDLKGKTA